MIKDLEVKRKWIEALRSGKYNQGVGYLNADNKYFCCLGVQLDVGGCEWVPEDVFDKNYDNPEIAFINDKEIGTKWSDSYLNEIGLTEKEMNNLIDMNDCRASFEDIADYIEKNL